LLRNSGLAKALIITRREVRDSLRDWRILLPIGILTLIFPWLMNYTAGIAIDFVRRYNAPEIGTRLVPFLMLIVGFFPTSFSLVIALETFVGEKERNSLEPLLSMPISDGELYLGKMMGALLLPLIASTSGIAIYVGGLYFSLGYRPDPMLLLQVWVLTAVEALVMVSAAVVISSQTTSVRAANLLASFVIIPMALLVQAEAVIFFSSGREVLWVIIAGLLVVDVILVRMGVRIFNREEILGRELDRINLRRTWRSFKAFFLNGPVGSDWEKEPFALQRVYGRDLPELLRRSRLAIGLTLLAVVGSLLVGWHYADVYRLPPLSVNLKNLQLEQFSQSTSLGFMPAIRTDTIFVHNVRSLLTATVLAIFSFGSLAVILLALPMAIVGWLVAQSPALGFNPVLFTVGFFLPHGILEIPAAVLSTAFSLRIGATLMSPPHKLDVGSGLLMSIADFVKVFVLVVIPLLLVAAFIEASLTPRLIVALFGS
jgi:uncharacterized membrane protein SpoIIM required for sporulation/ABC-type transport system involved in multi-copper enzyme maturation permease subunit